ncbi:hypothetical protein SKAU_G00287790, partial [Synaphobranchus kaupii]
TQPHLSPPSCFSEINFFHHSFLLWSSVILSFLSIYLRLHCWHLTMTNLSTTENIMLGVQDIQQGALDLTTDSPNMTYISVQPSTQQNSTRLDWILYTVPASAFLLGLYLFSLVLIKHKRREERNIHKERLNKMKYRPTQCRVNGFSTESVAKAVELCKAQLVETQSYENVEAAIYFNQEAVTYYVPEADGDGDEGCETDGARGETQNDVDSLHHPQNLTDTEDGESYENMECSLYAQPHKQRDIDAQDGGEASFKHNHIPPSPLIHAIPLSSDYINPNGIYRGQEEGEKHWNHPTDTDDESYENMDSSAYSQQYIHSDPNRPHRVTAVQEEEDDDSYVKMASIT